MWEIKRLEVVDPNGNSVSIVGKKVTLNVKINNRLFTTTFACNHTSPEIHIAIQDFVRQLCIDASNIN